MKVLKNYLINISWLKMVLFNNYNIINLNIAL